MGFDQDNLRAGATSPFLSAQDEVGDNGQGEDEKQPDGVVDGAQRLIVWGEILAELTVHFASVHRDSIKQKGQVG